MIMDLTGLFSNAQAVTATTASTNVIDLGQPGTPYGATAPLRRDVGHAGVELYVGVTETFNNLTSLTISIETDDNTAFSSPKTTFTSPAYALADLALGARFLLPEAFPTGTDEQYVRLKYTVAGTAPTTGKITAGTVASRQKSRI